MLFIILVIVFALALTPFSKHKVSGNVLILNGAPIDSSRVSAGFVENDIRSGLKIGSSPSEVDQFLSARKIEHSFDQDSKIVYAIVRQLRGTTLIARQNLALKFRFDESLRLTSIETNLEYTGP